nr:Chain I, GLYCOPROTEIN GPC [Lymphocytic choriomeningitis virus (strain WE)]3TBW_J Chain J, GLYCOPROTEIN GPC [Lymphocytic choriomeningitis virus (strain WE)]3TBW_K Chain K, GLYCOPROTEIN GPC [Lymphocytic choriomeningitis virus (strain WE)]3TBW_L Chain L, GLYCOPROTEIN GPC [Lymphocytic choriomeningitis virus (strain WE)]
KGPSNFATM